MKFSRFIQYSVSCSLIALSTLVYAQKQVTLEKADQLRAGSRGKDTYQRVIGNVVFKQNETTIYCDSAHFYKKENAVDAFGKVRITEGDSVTITGSKLEYDGNTKKAKLRKDVVFTKLAMATLYTDFLDYSRPDNLAYYYNGGKLVDSVNVLTSNKGYYKVNSNLASFKRKVVVKNPDYTMTADSLQYNSRTKLIYFVSPTTVINKDSSTFIYEGGVYNTITKSSDIREGVGESEDYTIEGKRFDSDGTRNILKIRGDVVMTSKKQNLKIYGQSSDYFRNKSLTKIYDNAYVAKVTDNGDTLFMTADTLISIDHKDPSKKRLLAYHNVKIYKSDLQGLADSLEYRFPDSTIYFYKKPVLWSQDNQMTADSIRMLIKNNTISRIYLVANAFVISQDTLFNFNQIKGRKMTAELANSKISRVYVDGNGETLYYALDEKTNSLMGMNKSICSRITIRFKEGQVNNLSFYVKPDANFIPPHEFKDEDQTLKGFDWKEDEKPQRSQVVKTPPKKEVSIKKPSKKKPASENH